MTLGRAPLARRQPHYGVGALEERPVGTFLIWATVATGLMISYIVFDRYFA